MAPGRMEVQVSGGASGGSPTFCKAAGAGEADGNDGNDGNRGQPPAYVQQHLPRRMRRDLGCPYSL